MPKKDTNLMTIAGLLAIITTMSAFFLANSIIASSMNFDSEKVHSLYYFTIQSNILTTIWFAFVSLNLLSNRKRFKFSLNPNLTAIITTYILVTGLIYWAVLVPTFYKPDGNNTWLFTPSNIWLHTLTPLTAVIVLLFSKRNYEGSTPKKALFYFFIYPIIYIVFGIYNATKGIYLYPMFNPVMLGGWVFVGLSLGIIAIIFTILYLLLLRLFKQKI